MVGPTRDDPARDLPRARYRDLERRKVPDLPRLDGTIAQLLRELAPTVESALSSARSPKKETKNGNPSERISRAAARGEEKLGELGEIWRRTVGDEIAGLSRPTRYRAGVLTVELDSAPLAAELESFAREHLREALAAEGLPELCDLKFKVRS